MPLTKTRNPCRFSHKSKKFPVNFPVIGELQLSGPSLLPRHPSRLRSNSLLGVQADGIARKHQLHAAVLLPAVSSVVRRDGSCLAQTSCHNHVSADALLNQVVTHRFGSAL